MDSILDDADSATVEEGESEEAQVNSKSRKSNNGRVEAVESTSSLAPPTTSRPTGGGGGAANNSYQLQHPGGRRNFSSEFKQTVLDAYNCDPDCLGNQRATARKFNIHRRQVQKWLTQLDKESECSQSSSPDQIVVNPEGSSLSNCSAYGRSSNNSPSTSTSSYEKESDSKEQQVEGSNVCRVTSADLSAMSSTAMAMNLNLTQTSTSSSSVIVPNTMAHLKLPYTSERVRNNSSPSQVPPGHSLVPPSIPSPNSILSKFYSLYTPAPRESTSSVDPTIGKYHGLNLNGDSSSKVFYSTPQQNKGPSSILHPQPIRNTRHRRQSYHQNGFNTQHIQILDEIASAYPHEDFSLLRQALIRNEVSFTKVSSSAPKSTFFPLEPTSENGGRYNGKPRTSSPTSPQNYHSNQNLALELHRQQNDYIRLLQQSGINFSDLSPEGLKGSSIQSKYPWLLAQAAATLGLPLMGTPPLLNGQKKQSPPHHVFVSPKPPSNSKPKTVAAALAATRNSPNSLLSQFATAGAFDNVNGNRSNGGPKKRSTAPRKRGKTAKQNSKPCTITRPDQNDDDGEFLDPTSILEVTTTANPHQLSNGFPSLNGDHSGRQFSQPMLLQDDDALGIYRCLESPEDQEIKKFLEQRNDRKSPSSGELDGEQITKAMALDAFTFDPEVAGDCRAVARKFRLNVRVVMKWIKESSSKASQQQVGNISGNYDNTKPLNENGNEDVNNEYDGRGQTNDQYGFKMNVGRASIHQEQSNRYLPSIPTSSNKRKNSKPNQICDFSPDVQEDDLGFDDVPLDMMIPIKKRRVSSQE